MAWPNVTPSDIESRWRLLTEPEVDVAATRTDDAEAELRAQLRLRGLTAPPTFDVAQDADDWERRYRATVVEMVRRYMQNPDGWSSESETGDDYSYTNRRDATVATGALYATEDEVSRLVPSVRRRRGAFSIRLGAS